MSAVVCACLSFAFRVLSVPYLLTRALTCEARSAERGCAARAGYLAKSKEGKCELEKRRSRVFLNEYDELNE